MRCDRDNCEYVRHSKVNNNGGTHCCLACKNGIGHGSWCEKKQILINHKHFQAHAVKRNFPSIANRTWFLPTELSKIYNFPPIPKNPPNVVVGVISFGGGLYGKIGPNNRLLSGDIITYWSNIGIPLNKQPKVFVKLVNGARLNTPDSSTTENTIDIETLGGCYPSPNLTIVLYIVRNSIAEFSTVLNYALADKIHKPSILSISWGQPEINYSPAQLDTINRVFERAYNKGIIICVASGDNGSSDGTSAIQCADFPASSPYVIAVGGTSLVSPTDSYTADTVETAWTSGGGAISDYFPIPTYQQRIASGSLKRNVPDVSSNADPKTGVCYLINGKLHIVGGTSIAAPTIAAFFALCNKKQSLTEKLYTASNTCFHDITSGSNGYYNCKVGYDNCTGNGSINGVNLLSNL